MVVKQRKPIVMTQINNTSGFYNVVRQVGSFYAEYAPPFLLFGFVYAMFFVIGQEVEKKKPSITDGLKKIKFTKVVPSKRGKHGLSQERVIEVLRAQQKARKKILSLSGFCLDLRPK